MRGCSLIRVCSLIRSYTVCLMRCTTDRRRGGAGRRGVWSRAGRGEQGRCAPSSAGRGQAPRWARWRAPGSAPRAPPRCCSGRRRRSGPAGLDTSLEAHTQHAQGPDTSLEAHTHTEGIEQLINHFFNSNSAVCLRWHLIVHSLAVLAWFRVTCITGRYGPAGEFRARLIFRTFWLPYLLF